MCSNVCTKVSVEKHLWFGCVFLPVHHWPHMRVVVFFFTGKVPNTIPCWTDGETHTSD